MPLTVIVGGQYGSEGKGKLVSHAVAQRAEDVAVVRCGGANAGHTADGPEGRMLLRQLPAGAVDSRCRLYLAAGMQIDLDVLRQELDECPSAAKQLRVDRNATLIEASDVEAEQLTDLYGRIASTLTGTGSAAARKVLRHPSVRRAADVDELRPWVTDVSAELNELLDRGAHVIVEGTQGFGLSLHHGAYPYVTGRDTTAAGFLSEAGLAPSLVTEVVAVLRTYPIRVGGHSGPLPAGELTWEQVAERAGYPGALAEYTTVTGRLRRVGEFDWNLAAKAVQINRPTALALHGLDYLDYRDLGARHWDDLGMRSRRFVDELERRLGVPVRWLYTGPAGEDLIDRSADLAESPVREPRSIRMCP